MIEIVMMVLAMAMLAENRLSLTELAQEANVNTSTVWRWAKRGARGVVLETFLLGGKRFTSREAFERFVERTTAAAESSPAAGPSTPRQREAAVARAEKEAEELGI